LNDSKRTTERRAKALVCDFEAYLRADEPDKEGTDRAISNMKGQRHVRPSRRTTLVSPPSLN
jgi:hypothetical protein